MIRLREGTKDDARTILADLSTITAADVAAHKLAPEAVDGIIDFYFEAGAVHTMMDDGEPICIAGVALVSTEWVCWMLGREPFWTVRPSIWRILRRYSQLVLASLHEDIHSYSASPHPQLPKWMQAMGFDEAEPHGQFRHFIYRA